ncbi:MAG: ligand-binding sensor domain-containing protein [Bryobacteraceae bacterium]
MAAVLLICLAALIYGSSAVWRASQALKESARITEDQSRIRFTESRFNRPIPAGVEQIAAPAGYTDAAIFRDKVYICGPAGLFAYDAAGKLAASYRVGLELPAAPLVRMAVGLSSASSQQELWIATAGEGLLAFDGASFRQIRSESPEHRALTDLVALPAGRILMGSEKAGVLVYDGEELRPYHPALAGIPVTALAGTETELWVGTLDQGLLHWRSGRLQRFGETEGLPDRRVLSLAARSGSAWAGTALGIAEFRDGRFHRLLGEGLFARSLLLRDNDALAVGTLDEGVFEVPLNAQRLRPHHYKAGHYQAGQIDAAVERMMETDGELLALAGGGLYSVAPSGSWEPRLAQPRSILTNRNISALSVDRSGRLWIGYFDRGLDILEAGFERASHLEDDQVFCINRIVHDESRYLTAVATANGLVLLDAAARKRQVLTRDDGLIANHVTDIALTPDGMIAATPAGVSILGGPGVRSLYAFHGLVNNHAYTLGFRDNRLLVGTLGGLSIVDGGQVKANFTTANSPLGHNWITAIASLGEDWFIGTYGAGVLHLDASGAWHSFDDLRGSIEINPNAMTVTESRVYAGTLDKGLLIYERSRGRWHTMTNGLPSLNITAVAASNGYIYIGTDNGLVRMEEASN